MTLECQVYQRQLRLLGYGLPLYEPNLGGLYDCVRIGDVGITKSDGSFLRLFNCFPEAYPDINSEFGVPDTFESLPERYRRSRYLNEIAAGYWIRSEHIKQIDGEVDFSVAAVSAGVSIRLTGANEEAAALHIKHSAQRENAVHDLPFKQYNRRHYESWERFLRDQGIGTRHSGPLRSSAVDTGMIAAGGALSARSESTIDVPVRVGPKPYNPRNQIGGALTTVDGPCKDQCIFLRGYHISIKLVVTKNLKAVAEPQDPDVDRDSDMDADIVPAEFDSDEEHRVERPADHEIVLNYIHQAGAEIAIIHESDICAIAKAVGDNHKGMESMSLDDLLEKGIKEVMEFDS